MENRGSVPFIKAWIYETSCAYYHFCVSKTLSKWMISNGGKFKLNFYRN